MTDTPAPEPPAADALLNVWRQWARDNGMPEEQSATANRSQIRTYFGITQPKKKPADPAPDPEPTPEPEEQPDVDETTAVDETPAPRRRNRRTPEPEPAPLLDAVQASRVEALKVARELLGDDGIGYRSICAIADFITTGTPPPPDTPGVIETTTTVADPDDEQDPYPGPALTITGVPAGHH